MSDMQRSVVASLANRPVTRFVRPSVGYRTRRMGLRAFLTFTPAPSGATVLRRADLGPIVGRRNDWRSAVPTPPPARVGAPRPSVSIHWAHSARGRADRRSSAAATPWRG